MIRHIRTVTLSPNIDQMLRFVIDSLSQIALGAAVGEAVLGKRVGNKAPVWGAVMGTVPDLDVLTSFFVSPVTQLGWHRGFSHSAVFALVAAPIFGWLIYRFHKGKSASWKGWSLLAFWAIFTHPILDMFTVYGTQFLQPFSNYPVAFNSIFIIDPFYTVPLATGLAIAVFYDRLSRLRRVFNYMGLILSCSYLLVGVTIKLHVNEVVTTALREQGKEFDQYMSAPMPFNAFLWMSIAETDAGYWIGLHSLFDNTNDVNFRFVERKEELLAGFSGPALDRLHWFSQGYYIVRQEHGSLYYIDIRFGRLDGWMDAEGSHIFKFRLIPDSENPAYLVSFAQERGGDRAPEDVGAYFSRYFARVFGDRSVEYRETPVGR